MPLYVNLWVKRHHLSDLFPVISSQPFGDPLCVDDGCARHESLAQPPTASGITAKSPYSPVVVVKSSRNPFRSETSRLSATASIATAPLNAISSDACVFSPQISHNFVLPAINPPVAPGFRSYAPGLSVLCGRYLQMVKARGAGS